jgi:hypothetical protein
MHCRQVSSAASICKHPIITLLHPPLPFPKKLAAQRVHVPLLATKAHPTIDAVDGVLVDPLAAGWAGGDAVIHELAEFNVNPWAHLTQTPCERDIQLLLMHIP